MSTFMSDADFMAILMNGMPDGPGGSSHASSSQPVDHVSEQFSHTTNEEDSLADGTGNDFMSTDEWAASHDGHQIDTEMQAEEQGTDVEQQESVGHAGAHHGSEQEAAKAKDSEEEDKTEGESATTNHGSVDPSNIDPDLEKEQKPESSKQASSPNIPMNPSHTQDESSKESTKPIPRLTKEQLQAEVDKCVTGFDIAHLRIRLPGIDLPPPSRRKRIEEDPEAESKRKQKQHLQTRIENEQRQQAWSMFKQRMEIINNAQLATQSKPSMPPQVPSQIPPQVLPQMPAHMSPQMPPHMSPQMPPQMPPQMGRPMAPQMGVPYIMMPQSGQQQVMDQQQMCSTQVPMPNGNANIQHQQRANHIQRHLNQQQRPQQYHHQNGGQQYNHGGPPLQSPVPQRPRGVTPMYGQRQPSSHHQQQPQQPRQDYISPEPEKFPIIGYKNKLYQIIDDGSQDGIIRLLASDTSRAYHIAVDDVEEDLQKSIDGALRNHRKGSAQQKGFLFPPTEGERKAILKREASRTSAPQQPQRSPPPLVRMPNGGYRQRNLRKRPSPAVREVSSPSKRRQSDAHERPMVQHQPTVDHTPTGLNGFWGLQEVAQSTTAAAAHHPRPPPFPQSSRAPIPPRSYGRVPQSPSPRVNKPTRLPATVIQVPIQSIPPSLINVCEFDPEELEMPGTNITIQLYNRLDQALAEINDLKERLDLYQQIDALKNANNNPARPNVHCVRCHQAYAKSDNHDFACRIKHSATPKFHESRRNGGSWWQVPCCDKLVFSSREDEFDGGRTNTYCRISRHTSDPKEVDYHHRSVQSCLESGCLATLYGMGANSRNGSVASNGVNGGPVNGNVNGSVNMSTGPNGIPGEPEDNDMVEQDFFMDQLTAAMDYNDQSEALRLCEAFHQEMQGQQTRESATRRSSGEHNLQRSAAEPGNNGMNDGIHPTMNNNDHKNYNYILNVSHSNNAGPAQSAPMSRSVSQSSQHTAVSDASTVRGGASMVIHQHHQQSPDEYYGS